MLEEDNKVRPHDEAELPPPLERPPDPPQPFDADRAFQRGELQWRLRILALAVPASIGILMLLGRLVADQGVMINIGQLFGYYTFSVAVATVFAISGFGLMFMYLQTGLNHQRFLQNYLDRARRTWRSEVNRATDFRQPLQPEARSSESVAQEAAPLLTETANALADNHVQQIPPSVIDHLSSADYDKLAKGVVASAGDDLFGRLAKEFEGRMSADMILRQRVAYSSHEMAEMIDR
jgi:hypothetical protein